MSEHANEPASPVDPAAFWEERYAGSDRVWSGRVNAVPAEVAATLEPGAALDLGCGEGGDAVWLTEHGWTVTGVDIAPTALARGTAAARGRGLGPDRIRFIEADLNGFETDDRYDLVAASYLHSPATLDRMAVLRQAGTFVATGGHLLITSHAAPPPWAKQLLHDHHVELLPPDEDLAQLAFDPQTWEVELCEIRRHEVTAPDGSAAMLDDGVILLRRR